MKVNRNNKRCLPETKQSTKSEKYCREKKGY